MTVFDLLSQDVVMFLRARRITTPSPIQEKAIPKILNSEDDLLLLAPTGSGKTEAVLLPLLNRLYKRKQEVGELAGIFIIYITPLRALNRDIFRRVEELCSLLGISIDVRHGDTTQYVRRKQALSPPNLLITTPETFQAILLGKLFRYHFKSVTTVIIDEIHDLVNSKRGVQLSLGLERLEKIVGKKIRRIGLSATVSNPHEVANFLAGGSNKARILWVGHQAKEISLNVEMPLPSETHYEIGEKIAYPPHSTARLLRIIDLIKMHSTTIVFTNTRAFAEMLGSKIRLIKPCFDFDVHHGSLSRNVRLSAENRLKTGKTKGIIATSSLELGIDIGKADLVVQYSSPREVKRALQRFGRAGHSIKKTTKGIFLATVNIDDVLESGVILRRVKANKIEPIKIPRKAWDVLVHQIAGVILDHRKMTFEDLERFIRASYPYRDITKEELKWILEFMAERKLVLIKDRVVRSTKRTRMYYYDNLSVIPDVRKINAIDSVSRNSIGVLDEDYVLENVNVGTVFVIRGRPYKVVNVDVDEVFCMPAKEVESKAPKWIGEMIPVPFQVAIEVGDLLNRIVTVPVKKIRDQLRKEYGLSSNAIEYLVNKIKQAYNELKCLPSKKRLIVEDFGKGIVIHLPYGSKVNETFGLVISALLSTRTGVGIAMESDPYRVLLTASDKIDSFEIANILKEYSSRQISIILRLALKNTQTLASRFFHVARRMGIIKRNTKIKETPIKRLMVAYEGTPVYVEAVEEVLREKMDEPRLIELFDKIREGEVEIKLVRTEKPSILARLIIEEKTRFEVISEITEENEILRLVEKRLLTKQLKLVCMNGDWESVRTVKTLNEPIVCPNCCSHLVAIMPANEKSLARILRKKRCGSTLTNAEKKVYRQALKSAMLVANYGKKAVMTLAGVGIGPSTAARILSPSIIVNRLKLLREIAMAEKKYAQTRQFWDR